jgi:hypothetical protein
LEGLVERLKAQNAKERFWLLNAALGGPPLEATYRDQVGSVLDVDIPDGAWWAMDYHLDWLACALQGEVPRGAPQPLPAAGWALGTQEDVDLIVAWDEGDTTQVVLIEAKGVTAHSNTQVGSKLKKLRLLFGDDGLARPGVTPHFLLTSPSRPTKLATDHMPQWCKDDTGRLRWLHLDVPDNLVYPTRCDDSGNVTKLGGKWLLRFR